MRLRLSCEMLGGTGAIDRSIAPASPRERDRGRISIAPDVAQDAAGIEVRGGC